MPSAYLPGEIQMYHLSWTLWHTHLNAFINIFMLNNSTNTVIGVLIRRDVVPLSALQFFSSDYSAGCLLLAVQIKCWAKAQNINDPKLGTLNSYAISLLVVFHLQVSNTPFWIRFFFILVTLFFLHVVEIFASAFLRPSLFSYLKLDSEQKG